LYTLQKSMFCIFRDGAAPPRTDSVYPSSPFCAPPARLKHNRVGLNSPHSLFSAIGPARVRGIGQKDRKAHEARTPPNRHRVCAGQNLWDFQRETCANVKHLRRFRPRRREKRNKYIFSGGAIVVGFSRKRRLRCIGITYGLNNVDWGGNQKNWAQRKISLRRGNWILTTRFSAGCLNPHLPQKSGPRLSVTETQRARAGPVAKEATWGEFKPTLIVFVNLKHLI